jgi:DnaJ-domain-containing protein 1
VANPIDLERLCQGASVWNAWRQENPHVVPDLSDANLTLSQRQFGRASGGPIDLRGCNLAGAALRYATLSEADLADAILSGADLIHSRLDRADLSGADLTDALCDNADLANARLDDAVLTGASFANARNLTEDQLAFAYGDASTLLPAALMPPASWFPDMEDGICPEYPVPDQLVDQDLYEVLGVDRDAKQDDIRSAFRILVKKLHPDVNPDDERSQEAFKKVSIAYRILSDAEKRVRYDRGEIGGDGEVNPEFEARRQFRRYAFRFYAAAAMSLVLAAGVLGVVWHAVLTDDGGSTGRVEIAVATPPKSAERLDNVPSELKVDFRRQPRMTISEDGGDASSAKTEVLGEPLSAQDKPDPSGLPAEAPNAAADETAQAANAHPGAEPENAAPPQERQASLPTPPAEAAIAEVMPVEPGKSAETPTLPPAPLSAPPPVAAAPAQDSPGKAPAPEPAAALETATPDAASPPAAQSAPPQDAKVTSRPLFQAHEGQQARPAQADAARDGAPKAEAAAARETGLSGIPFANRLQPARSEPFLRPAERRQGGAVHAISALFSQRAIKYGTAAADRQQATASMDPLASREDLDGQNEIRDIYTHSLPESGTTPGGVWPGFKKPSRSARRDVPPASRDVAAKVPDARESRPAPANRKQAVSDIFAGGL